jgi:hypothetical protein
MSKNFTRADDLISCEEICEADGEKDSDVTIAFDEFKGAILSAALFIFDEEDVWVPKKFIVFCDRDENEVTIRDWIAVEKGLV